MFETSRRDPWVLVVIAAAAYAVGYPVFCKIDAAFTHNIHQYNGLYVADLRAMSDFRLDQINGQTQDIPEAFRRLDGQRVELAGEMWCPLNAGGTVHNFELVYSISNCCFRGPPQAQHFVDVRTLPGLVVSPAAGMVSVTGILHVGVEKTGGTVQCVYRMDAERVKK